jgi:hypothetical protein
MKMEHELRAAFKAVVAKVHVKAGRQVGAFLSNAVNLIENAGSSHEFHECHETLSLSVARFLALFVRFVQFVAVLLLPKQEFRLKLMALVPALYWTCPNALN